MTESSRFSVLHGNTDKKFGAFECLKTPQVVNDKLAP